MLDKNFIRQRIAFVRQGSEVERWHTKRMIQRNDVGHHSFHVAWLAYLLTISEESNRENVDPHMVVMSALAHDLAEHYTGDVPGDFKREAGIRDQFSQYEYDRFMEVGLEFEGRLNKAEKRCLKFADMLEGAFFCISEASLGNARVGLVFRNYRTYIDGFAPFNETEAAIVEYIDELWLHYGVDDAPAWGKTAHSDDSLKKESIMGQEEHDEDDAPELTPEMADMGQISRGGEVVRPARGSLMDAIRAEEAEGRATPSPSKAPGLEVPSTSQYNVDDTNDDRASPDLADEPRAPANARQHGGDHYKGVGYEHWDLVLDTHMNYFQGCATKYVTRARKHSGGCRLNIEKAIHYVDKLTEALDADRIKIENHVYSVDDIANFKAANQLTDLEAGIISDIIAFRLGTAREKLGILLDECPPSE